MEEYSDQREGHDDHVTELQLEIRSHLEQSQ